VKVSESISSEGRSDYKKKSKMKNIESGATISSKTTTNLVVLFLILLGCSVQQQLLPNPCHNECEPYMCHGPLASHCVACSHPNKKLEDGFCTCKLGYFNNPHNNSECSAFLKDCEQGTVQLDGTVFCSKCYLET
jgi:hypothetical protein